MPRTRDLATGGRSGEGSPESPTYFLLIPKSNRERERQLQILNSDARAIRHCSPSTTMCSDVLRSSGIIPEHIKKGISPTSTVLPASLLPLPARPLRSSQQRTWARLDQKHPSSSSNLSTPTMHYHHGKIVGSNHVYSTWIMPAHPTHHLPRSFRLSFLPWPVQHIKSSFPPAARSVWYLTR